ncbi:hypothetical protein OSB04_014835 [Centaurea solstitialis]|uniref:Uncharacterized protein n=1 Tax=Centaurea solstitialis TaxID=347529 RepID=A0AA38WFY9_9ASTR|nr:hypothetical protein OSB04_014835 [Centaurea solstitialis]
MKKKNREMERNNVELLILFNSITDTEMNTKSYEIGCTCIRCRSIGLKSYPKLTSENAAALYVYDIMGREIMSTCNSTATPISTNKKLHACCGSHPLSQYSRISSVCDFYMTQYFLYCLHKRIFGFPLSLLCVLGDHPSRIGFYQFGAFIES